MLWSICDTYDHGYIYPISCNYNPVFASCMTYHKVCNKSNTTGATSVAVTAYLSGTSELSPVMYMH
jgi:hypothetical protein